MTETFRLNLKLIRRLFDQGYTDRAIARMLGVSHQTIQQHTRWMRAEASYQGRKRDKKVRSSREKDVDHLDLVEFMETNEVTRLKRFVAFSGATFE